MTDFIVNRIMTDSSRMNFRFAVCYTEWNEENRAIYCELRFVAFLASITLLSIILVFATHNAAVVWARWSTPFRADKASCPGVVRVRTWESVCVVKVLVSHCDLSKFANTARWTRHHQCRQQLNKPINTQSMNKGINRIKNKIRQNKSSTRTYFQSAFLKWEYCLSRMINFFS